MIRNVVLATLVALGLSGSAWAGELDGERKGTATPAKVTFKASADVLGTTATSSEMDRESPSQAYHRYGYGYRVGWGGGWGGGYGYRASFYGGGWGGGYRVGWGGGYGGGWGGGYRVGWGGGYRVGWGGGWGGNCW